MKPKKLPYDSTEHWTEDYIKNDNPNSFVKAHLHYLCEALMHTHDFYELNFVMHGTGEYYHDKTCLTAHVGDVFITPPNIYHGYLKKEDFYIYNLCIRTDFFNYYKNEIAGMPSVGELIDGLPYILRLKNNGFAFHLSEKNLATLNNDLDLIVSMGELKTQESEYMKNAVTLKILTQLGFIYSKQREKWKKYKENTDYSSIMESIYYMKKNYSEKITLDKLSSAAHMSRSTYIRHFKELFNTSPMEYLRNIRVENAKRMLQDGKKSKSYIAQECGFYDIAHMGKYL